MNFLYFLEGLRTPLLDRVMQLITEFGSETAFLAAALILFWCVDKRKGYLLMSVGFVGTLANQFLKIACRIPRPWVLDPDFTIVESARAGATGYSFPSGHSQNAVGTFGTLTLCTGKKWLQALCIAACVLVPLSRMYLGVHTPSDTLVGAGMALCCIVLMKPVFRTDGPDRVPLLLTIMTVLGLAFLAYTELFPFPADVDSANLASANKNAWTMVGALSGVIVVYLVDRNYLNFPTEAIWYAQILKVLGGLILVLAVKSLLKQPLALLFTPGLARMVRYFLVVLTAGILWPMSFRRFSHMGNR